MLTTKHATRRKNEALVHVEVKASVAERNAYAAAAEAMSTRANAVTAAEEAAEAEAEVKAYTGEG